MFSLICNSIGVLLSEADPVMEIANRCLKIFYVRLFQERVPGRNHSWLLFQYSYDEKNKPKLYVYYDPINFNPSKGFSKALQMQYWESFAGYRDFRGVLGEYVVFMEDRSLINTRRIVKSILWKFVRHRW